MGTPGERQLPPELLVLELLETPLELLRPPELLPEALLLELEVPPPLEEVTPPLLELEDLPPLLELEDLPPLLPLPEPEPLEDVLEPELPDVPVLHLQVSESNTCRAPQTFSLHTHLQEALFHTASVLHVCLTHAL